MDYIPRLVTEKLIKLLKHFPSVVIVGARQVGKSTLVKHLFPHYSYVLFDPYEDVENARQDPDLFLDNKTTPLILDEVQYAPEVVSAVKRRIENNKTPGQYIFSGSQQWGVMKQMAESLTGRAVIMQLESFSLAEIAKERPKHSWLDTWLQKPSTIKFEPLELPKNTFEQLWRGFLPEVQHLPLEFVSDFHRSYQKTYIERDIRLLADLPDLHQFSRFVRLAAAFTAQEINFQHLGRDLGISNMTAKRWLSLLSEIFEWFEIPSFSMNSTKRISQKPKGYFADSGQVCFSQAISSPEAIVTSPLWGAIFETAVVNEVRKELAWLSTPCNLFHWRNHSGPECDLILERNGTYYPIEIKAKTKPNRGDAQGIEAFRASYPHLAVADGLVICLADTCYKVSERALALPWNVSSI